MPNGYRKSGAYLALGAGAIEGIRAMDLLNLTIQGGKQMADKVASQPRDKSVRAANQAKENT